MKRSLISAITLLLAVGLFAQVPIAQGGKVFDDLKLDSKILKMERKYAVYLPPDYETSERSYPVLYLLHGYGDDQTGWIQFGEVKHIADMAIAEGSATAMIIVMPSGNETYRGYFNDPKNDWRYEDFFFEEFIPRIESTFRIRKEKRFRAIAGLSMGGGGTFMYALHHPELFAAACPLSASCGPKDSAGARRVMDRNGWKASDKELEAWRSRHYAPDVIRSMDPKDVGSVRWYIDCGDDDFLYEGNSLTHIAMRDLQIPHEYRIRDGAHNWTYWREALPTVLEFVSMSMHQH